MRITPQMMLSNYKSDVSDAYASMNKAMRHAYNYRAFDLPSDDPLAAAETFQIHAQMSQNDSYASNISNVKGTLNSSSQIVQDLVSELKDASGKISDAITGTTNGDGRESDAQQLLYIRDSIVSQLNTKYADSYLFSGSGSGGEPFELVKDEDHPENDKLYYRGVNVDTGWTKDDETTAQGYKNTINNPSAPTSDKATAQTNLDNLTKTGTKRLKDLSSDPVYVDIGLGMEADAGGNIKGQSAFNQSTPGISFIGSGTDGNGRPQNVCSLLSKIAGALEASKGEEKLTDDERSAITKYTSAFDSAQSGCVEAQTGLGNRVKFLGSTSGYITNQNLNLQSQDNNVEFLDPYSAIEDFYSQMYCYNAALKVGGQVMQQSLMDYLK